ncbi:hypothetical protein LK10_05940 [Sinomonas humi]|uniref:Uncharacterized protein n=1 Tax=Sinomonas humi TaxID=1338436 RepID=A0A0B2ARG7_9MICC|nr:hypothetical protein LK10_05940 [Sinomonas humi]
MGRALAALAFGAVTVFWGQPTTTGAAWAVAGYLWLLLAAQAWLLRAERPAPDRASALTALVPYALAACSGIAIVTVQSVGLLAGGGAVALILVGLSDLARAVLARRGPASGVTPLGKDLGITGVVNLGAGILLPFFTGLGPHAILGVAGGGAIITGVLLAISALSLRHDSTAATRVA